MLTSGEGSCGGRGTRSAALFANYLKTVAASRASPSNIKSWFLVGGIKGWATAGEEYEAWMEGLVREHWDQFRKL